MEDSNSNPNHTFLMGSRKEYSRVLDDSFYTNWILFPKTFFVTVIVIETVLAETIYRAETIDRWIIE